MARKKKADRIVAVIDVETDPFKFGRIPKPFAAAFYDGEIYIDFWGDDCIARLVDFIRARHRDYVIYAHNGGKFDFFFMLDDLENPLKIINGRIAQASIGRHILRDSYAILPVPLSAYKKDEINYAWFEQGVREKHRADILHYLAKDCEYTHEMVVAFRARFGDKLTIGGAAISELSKIHPFPRMSASHDAAFRPYYFGGRVQAFESGIITGKFEIVDVNSMYPDAMKNKIHPCGARYSTAINPRLSPSGKLHGFGDRPFFITIEGHNKGAFPMRVKKPHPGLDFNIEYGVFDTTSHELQVAMQHDIFTPTKIHAAKIPHDTISFGDYVDKFTAEKIEGKKEKNKTKELIAKLLCNTPYGKFAQNPENYYDYQITDDGIPPDGFELHEIIGKRFIWKAPSDSEQYLDVAIAASITGASRAKLLDALCTAQRPIYCDTDSIVCEKFYGEKDDSKLGAWKVEAECNKIAIAGKKLYAAFDGKECVKFASKGARLTPAEIVRLAKGESVKWQNDAPSFSLGSKTAKFVERVLTKRI